MIPEPTAEQLEWFERDAYLWPEFVGAGDPRTAMACAVAVAAHYKRLYEAKVSHHASEHPECWANDADPKEEA